MLRRGGDSSVIVLHRRVRIDGLRTEHVDSLEGFDL